MHKTHQLRMILFMTVKRRTSWRAYEEKFLLTFHTVPQASSTSPITASLRSLSTAHLPSMPGTTHQKLAGLKSS